MQRDDSLLLDMLQAAKQILKYAAFQAQTIPRPQVTSASVCPALPRIEKLSMSLFLSPKTREMATAEIYNYIEMFYNRTRRHRHLSGVRPEAFEAVSKRA